MSGHSWLAYHAWTPAEAEKAARSELARDWHGNGAYEPAQSAPRRQCQFNYLEHWHIGAQLGFRIW